MKKPDGFEIIVMLFIGIGICIGLALAFLIPWIYHHLSISMN